ncbi:molybdopterin-dependent oxidoreductase [Deinococcus actinosclerus]|uniref:molybdopterin-dependent oxidoreductase n=1 Tax=Deinococcus actinosclerus TaxID=1768108 RepID=UPI000AB1A3A6|nr:molybdopterin-dependent oxidoreductase [Deinococcus actinosclerus]
MTPLHPARVALSVLLLHPALLHIAAAQTWGSPASWKPFTYARAAQPTPARKPGEKTLLALDGTTGTLKLTLRQLQAMPAMRYTILHRQLKQTFTYQGVTLRDLAARGGFAGKDLRVYAANGYFTTIHADDYMNEPIMLAYSADGQPITTLQKGPLTVVLPAQPARLNGPEYGAAWVWYAERIAPLK